MISVQLGGNFYGHGYAAVVRPYSYNDKLQWVRWSATKGASGKDKGHTYIKNHGGQCLDISGASTSNHAHLIWYPCHHKWNQDWYYDTKGIEYPKFPVGSNVKFRIRSKMQYHRVITRTEHIGYNQYRLRIHDTDVQDIHQWWVYDRRTNTIRADDKRSYVLANQYGQNFNVNVAAVARPFVDDNFVRISYFNDGLGTLRNNGKKCLDVAGGSNAHNAHLIFWHCHHHLN